MQGTPGREDNQYRVIVRFAPRPRTESFGGASGRLPQRRRVGCGELADEDVGVSMG